ncbi:uncharacterized protein VP01_4826g1 [Puccinia sorghi]|uniref:Condensin complex subunit 1 C-terminal domain-containing protein n=1 Tax=Puccinia sorghi TaxID=27349 RepID=A0A0L6UMG3_9BASI|nr:uncharacterized protein VP01_4826g1 [Puccinia sorghi]
MSSITKGMDDEDEVLLALAGELNAAFVEFLGGPSFLISYLSLLKTSAQQPNHLLKLLHFSQLSSLKSTLEWLGIYLNRFCISLDFAYPTVSDTTKDEMRRMYSALCADKKPMVQRAAAKESGVTQSWPLAKVLSQSHLITALIPVFRKLAADDQDLGRLLTVVVLIAIASSLPDKAVCKKQLGSTMKSMVSDQSWRVRYMIADHFAQLAESAGEDVVWEDLVRAFVHLLNNNEAEV